MMNESGGKNSRLKEALRRVTARRVAAAHVADGADALEAADAAVDVIKKQEAKEREKKEQEQKKKERMDAKKDWEEKAKVRLREVWGENDPRVDHFMRVARRLDSGFLGMSIPPLASADQKVLLEGRTVLHPNDERAKKDLLKILKKERVYDVREQEKEAKRSGASQEGSAPQKTETLKTEEVSSSGEDADDRDLSMLIQKVDGDLVVDGAGKVRRKKALKNIWAMLHTETNIRSSKDLEMWIARELNEVYGSDRKRRDDAVREIKNYVHNDSRPYMPEARIWAGKKSEDLHSKPASSEAEDVIADAEKSLKSAKEGGRKEAIDNLIKDLKKTDGTRIDVTKISGWDEKKFRSVLGVLIQNPKDVKAQKDAQQWGPDVWAQMLQFVTIRKHEENERLQRELNELQGLVKQLEEKVKEIDSLKEAVDGLKRNRVLQGTGSAERNAGNRATGVEGGIHIYPPGYQQGVPQGAPQQWQRPIGPAGYESPYGMAQPGYRWVQEPIPGYVPPQPQQAPAPDAPRAEAPRAEKAPEVIHMPPDPTLKTSEEAPKSPARQVAEEMKKSVEGKLPSSIESVLMQKRGETPMWKRVRNTVGLMLAGGIAGATLVATAGVPVFLSGMLAGSQLAAFAPILTGVGSGAVAGLASGATRGALDARSAISYLKEKDSNKYISWNEIFTHVFRKSAVGVGFGAVGGGIGAGVMDAYGDQIRAGAGALGDWANKEATDLKEGLSGAKDWLSGLFGSGAVTEMPATPVLPGCTSADAMNALRVDVDGIKAALSTIISNQTVDAEGIKTIAEAVKSGVSLSDLQSALAGVQTNIESSISALSVEQQTYFRELFNRYGDTAYYFFQQNIVMPDVPADIVPEEPSLPDAPADVSEAPDASGVEDISAIDQAVMDAFRQPLTNGGVWTASERVWSAVGITPESGRVGSLDLLTYLTDLAEDYTQDGSVTGTRETSYFRSLGDGLLARMTGQEGVTQATIRNPINMAELFGNEKIQQDILRRISENPALSDSMRSLIEASAEKIFALANTALSK